MSMHLHSEVECVCLLPSKHDGLHADLLIRQALDYVQMAKLSSKVKNSSTILTRNVWVIVQIRREEMD